MGAKGKATKSNFSGEMLANSRQDFAEWQCIFFFACFSLIKRSSAAATSSPSTNKATDGS
jgi:hypothetical protein